MQFIQAAGYTRGRPDGPPLWIVIHDMEADETPNTAEATAAYFANGAGGRSVSSHYTADSNSIVQCVRLEDVAWTVGNRPGNNRGINWELAGFANQSRAQWLDEFGRAMFAQCAPVMRADAARYGIPIRRCTVDDLRAYRPGLTSHADLGVAFGGTDHTDPGPNFPWDYLLAILTGTEGDTDMPKVFHIDQGPLGGVEGVTNGATWYHLPSPAATQAALRIWGQDEILHINQADVPGLGMQVLPPAGGVPVSGPVDLTPAAVEAVADAVVDEQHDRLAG